MAASLAGASSEASSARHLAAVNAATSAPNGSSSAVARTDRCHEASLASDNRAEPAVAARIMGITWKGSEKVSGDGRSVQQPMVSPFRDAAQRIESTSHGSAQFGETEHVGGTAMKQAEGPPASVGDKADAGKAGSDVSRLGGSGRYMRGDRGRRERSDQLSAALLRMCVRADEQLREQAKLVLLCAAHSRT